MAIRTILTVPDEGLGKVCKPVKEVNDHVRMIIDDLTETMRNANGVGLAAPQVGILRRIVVVEVDGKLYELVNPEIVSTVSWQLEEEGCLSVPGLAGKVKRPGKVTVKALDRNGKPVVYEGTDLLARAFSHEIDHLDGIVYTSKAKEVHELVDDEQEDTEE